MDNQHLSTEKVKVQRLSHKGVLSNSEIRWETPPIHNKNKKFESIKEASEYYNIDSSCITKVCKNKRKTAKGLRFEYCE